MRQLGDLVHVGSKPRGAQRTKDFGKRLMIDARQARFPCWRTARPHRGIHTEQFSPDIHRQCHISGVPIEAGPFFVVEPD